MPFDEQLAARLRRELESFSGLSERKMFGGLAFMLHGNMCCGIVGGELMARVGPKAYEAALADPHARPMDFTGRPLRGFVYVGADGIRSDGDLRAWVERAARFAMTLRAK